MVLQQSKTLKLRLERHQIQKKIGFLNQIVNFVAVIPPFGGKKPQFFKRGIPNFMKASTKIPQGAK